MTPITITESLLVDVESRYGHKAPKRIRREIHKLFQRHPGSSVSTLKRINDPRPTISAISHWLTGGYDSKRVWRAVRATTLELIALEAQGNTTAKVA